MLTWKQKKRSNDPLEDVLLTWPSGDDFTVRHTLTSVSIKGITGSGKTSGSFMHLLRAIVAHPRSTLLILAQKRTDKEEIKEVFARVGKRDKLIVMEEGGNHRCDFLEELVKAKADDRALTEFFVNQGQSLQAGMVNSGDNAQYFRLLEDRIIEMTVGALRMGEGKVSAAGLRDFIATAAYRQEDLTNPEWHARFHNQVMKRASQASKSEIDTINLKNIQTFAHNEFVHLDDKPRSGAVSGVMNTAHVFCSGLCHWMCSRGSSFGPAVRREGKSVLVNFPYSEFGPSGRFIAGGMKFLWQKDILRAKTSPGDFFTVLVCDEFQESVTEFDSRFIAQCRSQLGCFLTATQTVSSELAALGGGQSSHHKVAALDANYGHRMYHTVDFLTAKAASEALGMRRESFISLAPGQPPSNYDMLMGQTTFNPSFSEQYQPILQPTVFMSGLRNGGPSNNNLVDGILIRPGMPFRTGENWQKVSFSQK